MRQNDLGDYLEECSSLAQPIKSKRPRKGEPKTLDESESCFNERIEKEKAEIEKDPAMQFKRKRGRLDKLEFYLEDAKRICEPDDLVLRQRKLLHVLADYIVIKENESMEPSSGKP